METKKRNVENKMTEYLEKLIEQFKTATGTKNVDIYSEQFIKEFSEWISGRQLIGKGYASMLEYMNIYPSIGSDTAEVGKGIYDTITSNSDLIVITPYSDELEKLTSGLVISSNLRVCNGVPILTENKGITDISTFISSDDIRRFITQNPYDQSCIENWEELHNSGENNITVGIYGSIYDKDVEQKIKELEMLMDKLDAEVSREYAVDRCNYYCAVYSNREALIKKLTR